MFKFNLSNPESNTQPRQRKRKKSQTAGVANLMDIRSTQGRFEARGKNITASSRAGV